MPNAVDSGKSGQVDFHFGLGSSRGGIGLNINELARLAQQFFPTRVEGPEETVEPQAGLQLVRTSQPSKRDSALYSPCICLILQGRKEVALGDRAIVYGAGESVLVSHVLPVGTRIVEASESEPYLCMVVGLDIGRLRGLREEIVQAGLESADQRSIEVHRPDPVLVETLARYLALSKSPKEAELLGPLVLKEIHFRVLLASDGGMLRELLRHDSRPSGISRATELIRQSFKTAIKIPELAEAVSMSASAFHKHFKAITGTTPLRYQKDLRLLEARRLLIADKLSVTAAAFEVGYESPTQFSREYARKFGVPPSAERAEV